VKKSICVLVNDPYSGFNGSYLQALKLTKSLVSKGESVYILANRYSSSTYYSLTECEIDGVHFFYLDSKLFLKSKFFSYIVVFLALFKLRKTISIVQIITSGYILPVIIFKAFSEVKVVLVTTSDRFKQKQKSLNLLEKFKLKLISKTDKIVVKSDVLFDKYRQLVEPVKLIKIKNGVDTDLYRSVSEKMVSEIKRRYGISLDSIVILYVGNIVREKGVRELVDAFITEVNIEKESYKLILVGDERLEPDYVRSIKNTINSKGYEKVIQLIPPLEKIHELYQLANAFILPSHREGFPNVVLEALSTDVPCYVTKLSYVSDINKYLSHTFNVGDEANAIREIIRDYSDTSKKNRCESSKFIKKYFSQNVTTISYIRLYRMLDQ